MKNQYTDYVAIANVENPAFNPLEIILDNASQTFLLIDKNLKVAYANNSTIDSMEKFYGFRIKIGISILDLVPEQRKSPLINLYADVFRGQTKRTETEFVLESGEKVIFENTFKPAKNCNNEIIGALVSSNEITEKKISENQLREFGNQYKQLFQNNPLPTWIYDLKTYKFLAVNEQTIKHFGYSKNEFLKMTIFDIHPKDKVEEIKEYIELNKHQNSLLPNWKQIKKNGEEIWVNKYSNIITYNGTEAKLVIIDDITTKIKAETELKKSNERFSLASKATSDAIYDWDYITNTLTWGEGLQTLFGYATQLTIKEWEELLHAEDKQRVVKSLASFVSHKKKKYWKEEYRFKKSDGTYCYILEKGFAVRDDQGNILRLIGAMQDVTDQKIKEQQLTESNERFDIAMKATHDLIWDWNLETGMIYRDKEGMKKVYGVENEESIQNIMNWYKRIHPQDQCHVQKVINDILNAKEQSKFDVEYRFKRDDGTYTYVYDRGILIRDKDNNPVRLIGAAQDITTRKKLEQELLQKELEKQKQISQATIETQELERSEIGKELHDNVNQVLTTTKLYLELSQSNPELKDDLIEKSSKNIIYVINEIRQLSRSLMNPSIGDLGLIESINDLVENINITGKLHISFAADDEIDCMLSENYKLMIYRIIQEALNNAIKHSGANKANISLRKLKSKIELVIKDNGTGFNQKTVKKGAGLNNIQNRVYIANGTLNIKSEEGKGCQLKINFPIKTNNPI